MAAARRGAEATGLDIDQRFVLEAQERAQGDPLTASARFVHGTIEDTDWTAIADPTVVTCYLLPRSMLVIRDKLKQLRSGTRIVSHAFGIPGWYPVKGDTVDGTNLLFLWVVP